MRYTSVELAPPSDDGNFPSIPKRMAYCHKRLINLIKGKSRRTRWDRDAHSRPVWFFLHWNALIILIGCGSHFIFLNYK